MAHTHDHSPASYGRAFAIGIALNLGFVIVEFVFGRLSNSLALIADAGHNLGDVLSLVLAWGAMILARRPSSHRYTYGMRRSSILAALINAIILIIAVIGIAWEAIQRFNQPGEVAGTTVIGVALLGIVINAVTAWLFFAGRHDDLNIRGAFLHLMADAGVSLGVVVSGAVILATGWFWLDPLISLVIAAIIFVGTWSLLRDAVDLALDGVPKSINIAAVHGYLEQYPGVVNVHDLHIWAMSTTEAALTAHLVLDETTSNPCLLHEVCVYLHDHFGIEHSTLQLETVGDAHQCDLVGCSAIAGKV